MPLRLSPHSCGKRALKVFCFKKQPVDLLDSISPNSHWAKIEYCSKGSEDYSLRRFIWEPDQFKTCRDSNDKSQLVDSCGESTRTLNNSVVLSKYDLKQGRHPEQTWRRRPGIFIFLWTMMFPNMDWHLWQNNDPNPLKLLMYLLMMDNLEVKNLPTFL